MSSDDEEAGQVVCLEHDGQDELSESESSIELTFKRQLAGDTQVEEDTRKLTPSRNKHVAKEGGGKAEPIAKPKAKAKATQNALIQAGTEATDEAKREVAQQQKS